mgnify:CR=1 FL=1
MYRTALVRKLGGFRSEYDFSQDYDLILRASEETEHIRHVERVLYFWRMLYLLDSNLECPLTHHQPCTIPSLYNFDFAQRGLQFPAILPEHYKLA